jgi:hypothetical protein
MASDADVGDREHGEDDGGVFHGSCPSRATTTTTTAGFPRTSRATRVHTAFQGIDIRVVRPLNTREKLAMHDAVSVFVRLGVRGEMWNLSYVGF